MAAEFQRSECAMIARDTLKTANEHRREALARLLHNAAKSAQKRLERRLRHLPLHLPSFWDKNLRVWVQAQPLGELCIFERSGRKRGKLIARSVRGNWFKLDPSSVAPLDVAPRMM